MNLRFAIAVSLVAATVHAGCGGVYHLERNAPGEADVRKRPGEIATGSRIPPDDPGEHIVEILGAPYYSFGDWNLSEGRTRPTHTLGLEVGAQYFEREESHPGTTTFFFCKRCRLYPGTAYGGNIGLELLHWGVENSPARPRNLYLEALTSHRNAVTLLGGWGIDLQSGRTGPRVGVTFFDFISINLRHRFGRGVTASASVQYTYGGALVWSR